MSPLTPRELDILREAAEGWAAKETGTRLGLSESTVRNYRVTIYEKLQAVTAAHAVAIGYQRGLLRPVSREGVL